MKPTFLEFLCKAPTHSQAVRVFAFWENTHSPKNVPQCLSPGPKIPPLEIPSFGPGDTWIPGGPIKMQKNSEKNNSIESNY